MNTSHSTEWNAELNERDQEFWRRLETLLADCPLVIERPGGTAHPRYPQFIYPLDYGYLEGSTGSDGAAVDVWRGSAEGKGLVGVLCTVDSVKNDAELKLVVDCSTEEIETILDVCNVKEMAAVFMPRPA